MCIMGTMGGTRKRHMQACSFYDEVNLQTLANALLAPSSLATYTGFHACMSVFQVDTFMFGLFADTNF